MFADDWWTVLTLVCLWWLICASVMILCRAFNWFWARKAFDSNKVDSILSMPPNVKSIASLFILFDSLCINCLWWIDCSNDLVMCCSSQSLVSMFRHSLWFSGSTLCWKANKFLTIKTRKLIKEIVLVHPLRHYSMSNTL